MQVVFKNSFIKDLRQIKERTIARRVQKVIESLEQTTTLYGMANLKPLAGATGYYRIRVGQYRLGLRIEGETVILVRFLHRKEIYRYFP